MSVRVITDNGLWDRFVDASPYGLLFHKWDFLKIAEKYTGCTLVPYGVYKGDELISIFPVFVRKMMGLKFVFSPPPRSGIPYLGFVMSPVYDQIKQRRRESYLDDVAGEINQELRRLSPNFVSVVTVPGFRDVRPFLWSGYDADANYTYVIDLGQSLDEIWKGFDDNCKKNIKRCDASELEIRESRDTREFYALMTERYRQQKLNYPIVSPEYLDALITAYPENLNMHYLYRNGDVIGIELICQYKDTMMLWLGESLIQTDVPANYYLRWKFIEKAKAGGFKKLEIQGANVPQLCANKSRFNPGLESGFNIHKKDTLGALAEWTYLNMMRKKVLSL
jgi:hypothetical protein